MNVSPGSVSSKVEHEYRFGETVWMGFRLLLVIVRGCEGLNQAIRAHLGLLGRVMEH